jgi:SEC-C motif-containing protein
MHYYGTGSGDKNMTSASCSCGAPRSFIDCCGRFLDAGEKPRTPEQLMRSRYTAYCRGGYGNYLVSTWLAAMELGYTAADFAGQEIQWQKLEVLDASQKGNLGTVEFKAWHAGGVHHERSLFKRIEGQWYYAEALPLPER